MNYFTHSFYFPCFDGKKKSGYVALFTRHRHTLYFAALWLVENKMLVLQPLIAVIRVCTLLGPWYSFLLRDGILVSKAPHVLFYKDLKSHLIFKKSPHLVQFIRPSYSHFFLRSTLSLHSLLYVTVRNSKLRMDVKDLA